VRYLLLLLLGAGTASLYWLHYTGHDNDSGAIAAAVILTIAGIAACLSLAYEEDKL